jgi:hypothetical protein
MSCLLMHQYVLDMTSSGITLYRYGMRDRDRDRDRDSQRERGKERERERERERDVAEARGGAGGPEGALSLHGPRAGCAAPSPPIRECVCACTHFLAILSHR